MKHISVRSLAVVATFAALASAAAATDSPASGARNAGGAGLFTFTVARAVVSTASQKVWTGIKVDNKTGDISFVASPVRPKAGRVYVLLKVTARNDGPAKDKVVYKDLVLKGKDGQTVRYLVYLDDKSFPMYTSAATTGRETEPNASDTMDLLLDVPANPGAMTLQYRSLPAVPISIANSGR